MNTIDNSKIRLRYAPSPTGKLHIGGARTALFNYLYAKNQNGMFFIRIEDTDLQRNLEYGESEQIDNLKWLGIEPDIYPEHTHGLEEFNLLRQSERLEIYNKYVDELLEKGHAYECYCSAEELEQERERQLANGVKAPKYSRKCLYENNKKEGVTPVIRLKMPENEDLTWIDGVRGKITINSNDIEDWVIRKSNNVPTYNFANVVDDHLMKVSHVMRGEEHISNTPKQVHLYQLFGWEVPHFSHLTIITGENNKKLSKRDNTIIQFITDYRERGYHSEAIFNFLALLGWSPKTEEEIFTKEQLIEIFNIENFSNAPSKFNLDKLKWTNNYYLQRISSEEAFKFLARFLDKRILEIFSKENQQKIIDIFRPQLHEGQELKELSKIFVEKHDSDLLNNYNIDINLLKQLLKTKLSNVNQWDKASITNIFKEIGTELNIKGKDLFMPIRIVFTGQEHGPNLGEALEIIGKDNSIKRI